MIFGNKILKVNNVIISDDIKAKIQAEYDSWKDKLWADRTKEERQKLGQFATPPQLTIKMLEKFDSLDSSVLDPCLGAGNLIAAAIIAGADPSKCYGIELDPVVHKVAQLRLAKLGVPPWHVKQGDALDPSSYEFEEDNVDDAKQFAVVVKVNNKEVKLLIVSKNKLIKEADFNSESIEKLKQIILKLNAKSIKIVKIA